MKPELSLEAVLIPNSDLLAGITTVLRSIPPPECFVWSNVGDTSEVRVWMTLREPAPPELIMELGRIPGMHRVRSHGPGQGIMEKLFRSPA